MRLVVLGRGLGLDGWTFAERSGLRQLVVGSIVRQHVEHRSPLGEEVKAVLDAGLTLSARLVRQMIVTELEVSAASSGSILEGFPRTPDDARWLADVLRGQGTPVTAALVSDKPGMTTVDVAGLMAFYGDLVVPAEQFFAS